MCNNQYNITHPWDNNFYYHYLQQHAMMSYHFQKLHSNVHYGSHCFDTYNPANVCRIEDISSSSCSSCSCCSYSTKTSTEYEEVEEEMDSKEGYDDEQYKDDDYDEESECEYEFNVDAILAMRAAKEEIKKKELAEARGYESSESRDEESSESKDEESSDSKENKSDSIVLVDSDKEDFEFIDLSNAKALDSDLYKSVGGFNKTEEAETRKNVLEISYGPGSKTVLRLESNSALKFEQQCDNYQPPLWPVLPVRL